MSILEEQKIALIAKLDLAEAEKRTANFLVQQMVGIDLHLLQACNLFNCTPDQVTPSMRHCGKLENYFRIYGGKH